jgi:hypothetical protein
MVLSSASFPLSSALPLLVQCRPRQTFSYALYATCAMLGMQRLWEEAKELFAKSCSVSYT